MTLPADGRRKPPARARLSEIDRGPEGEAAAIRPTRDALHRGKVVGRAVVTHTLDLLHDAGRLTDEEHAAGARLRAAFEGSWKAARVTAKIPYASDASDLDEDEAASTDEEREAEQRRLHDDKLEAERVCGRSYWPAVAHVCQGYAVRHQEVIQCARQGLRRLAAEWKPRERK